MLAQGSRTLALGVPVVVCLPNIYYAGLNSLFPGREIVCPWVSRQSLFKSELQVR
jgi:hypothetical protein